MVALVLLDTLARAQAPLYGYQIAKLLESDDDGALLRKQSALYPVLRNLEAAELLASSFEASEMGPPRRYYAITDLGRAVLLQWRQQWRATVDFVDSQLHATGAKP